MPQSPIKQALDLLSNELNTIDPTISKTYDNATLVAAADHINTTFSTFFNMLLIQKQRNPLIADELIAIANRLKDEILTLSNILTSSKPFEYQNQWIKVMSVIGSIDGIINISGNN